MKAALPYRYTKTELNTLLDSLVILVDTREQANDHILHYFEKRGIPFQERALDFGDYSFMLPADPALGLARDVHFSDRVSIERKASLEELSGCFTQERQRFENELIRATGSRMLLLVENADYSDIPAGNYDTRYRRESFAATLFTFIHRYDLHVQFIPPRLAGQWIRLWCRYYLREWLK